MTESRARFAAHALLVLSVLLGVLSIVLARQVDPRFAAGLGLLLITFPARSWFTRRAELAAALQTLAESWGKSVDRPRDMAALRRLYVVCDGAATSPISVDDATWDDLDLDAVFARLDRTLSTPGEYALYEMLRTPLLDVAPLEVRERRIGAFAADGPTRGRIRVELARLSRRSADAMAALLWGSTKFDRPNSMVLLVQGFLPAAAVAAAFFLESGRGAAIAIAVVFLLVNVVTHFSRKNEILARAEALRYTAALVRAGRRLAEVPVGDEAAEVRPALQAIGDLARAAKVIGDKGAQLAWSDQPTGFDAPQAVFEYLSIFFLIEVRGYYAVLENLEEHRDDLRRLFRLVGELDALQSTASWRAGLPRFCRPEFTAGPAFLHVETVVHPLVENAVPNTFELAGSSALVTGSNMSGKSTFLRTLGLSVVFAQTLHTCLAAVYRATPLRVASSVTIRDDVLAGRSFYLAEAERLLRLVRFAEAGGAALVLVDEPLRGTNSTERIAAVTEILLHLADVGALTVAATHELKIAELVGAKYAPYHFTDEVDADGLKFPHRIQPGVASTRNAIRLLARLGYPPDLVARADARAAALDGGRPGSGLLFTHPNGGDHAKADDESRVDLTP